VQHNQRIEIHPAIFVFGMGMWCALGTLSAAVGCATWRSHVGLGGIDVIHAARTGVPSGALLMPVWCIMFPMVVRILLDTLFSLYATTVV